MTQVDEYAQEIVAGVDDALARYVDDPVQRAEYVLVLVGRALALAIERRERALKEAQDEAQQEEKDARA